MKIGIMTITNGENYGNRLQNYAVQSVLESLGAEVETIKNVTGQYVIKEESFKEKSKEVICKIYKATKRINLEKLNVMLRYSRFKEFTNKYIKMSKYVISKDNIPYNIQNEYDFFVTGSDQVWNPNFYFNSEIDFLTFAKKGQRIAFSPSFGVNTIPEKNREGYSKWINGMDYLSVRENAGAKIIKTLTGRESVVLVDPTMLLSKKEWCNIAQMPQIKLKNKYILSYFLGNKDKEAEDMINNIAKKNNFEVINLLDMGNKFIYSINPNEFLALINNAELVCTDSFHGIVFSIIMKSPFVVFNRKDKEVSMNSRIDTLLSLFNMKNRISNNINNDEIFQINFDESEKIIKQEKEKALNYLKMSLNI